MSLISDLFRRFRTPRRLSVDGLCSPAELMAAVHRERSRADRNRGCFSIISFYLTDSQASRDSFRQLIHHLQQRSRSVDDLGWNEDGELWLILPNCSEGAARQLATQHIAQCSSRDGRLSFRLYHYSSDDCQSAEHRTKTVHRATGGLTQSQDHGPTDEADGDHNDLCSVPEHAHSISELFEQKLPWWKRAVDLAVSATSLLLLLPLFAVIAVAIKWDSRGPILFKQWRSGRGGRPFLLYKFRSMAVDAEVQKLSLLAKNEQDGPAFKMEQDPRVTSVGRVLRAFSLDELPQLWNVLRGEMSLVGPRPLPISEANACRGWQRQRTDATPGLTCIWQVKDRRSKIPFVDWVRMDIRYISGRSVWLDLRLIFETLLFVLRRKGV